MSSGYREYEEERKKDKEMWNQKREPAAKLICGPHCAFWGEGVTCLLILKN